MKPTLLHIKRKQLLLLAFSLMVAIPTYAQEAVWDSSMPFNFQTYFNLNVDPAQVDWYITDQTSGQEYQVPENEETAYIFNREGRDEWGKVTIRPEFTCPNSGDVKPFSPTTVSLEVLDYGLYFIGDFAQTEKFFTGDIDTDGNAYFDPSRPTVIYLHGRNHGSTQIHKREQLLDEVGAETLARKWRAQGWNVGIFYWSQISDDHPLNIEVKIHNGQIGGLTWRKEDDAVVWGDVNQFLLTNDAAAPDKSVSQLFLEAYDEFMTEYGLTGEDVRLTGHSLGGHLAVTAMPLIPPSQRPTRLALLDPWFSDTYDEDFDTDLTFLIDNGTLVEWYQTTWFNDMTQFMGSIKSIYDGIGAYTEEEYDQAISDIYDGINNLATYEAMLRKVAYLRLAIGYSDYVSVGPLEVASPTSLHNMAIVHYFNSIEDGVLPEMVETAPFVSDPAETVTGDYGIPYVKARIKGFNAAACDEIISRMMGHRYWQAGGGNTKTTEDDLYGFENGYAPAQLKPAQAMGTLEESTACNVIEKCFYVQDIASFFLKNQSGFEAWIVQGNERFPLLNGGKNHWASDDEGKICLPGEVFGSYLNSPIPNEEMQIHIALNIYQKPKSTTKAHSFFEKEYSIVIDNTEYLKLANTDLYDSTSYSPFSSSIVKLDRTEVRFNQLVSVEWNADQGYLDNLNAALSEVSDRLFDVSDGQAVLDTVIIVDDSGYYDAADVIIVADNSFRPNVDMIKNKMIMTRKVFAPSLNEIDQPEKSYSEPYPYDLSSHGNVSAITHEYGHLLFRLRDEYKYIIDGVHQNYSPLPKLFGLMEDAAMFTPNSGGIPGSEMSNSILYQNIDSKFKTTMPTVQWVGNFGESCWETFSRNFGGVRDSVYADVDTPIDKKFDGKLDNGLYFPGPTKSVYRSNIQIINQSGQGAIQRILVKYRIRDEFVYPASRATTSVERPEIDGDARWLNQGLCNGAGNALLLGVKAGDVIHAQYHSPSSGIYVGKYVLNSISSGVQEVIIDLAIRNEFDGTDSDDDDYISGAMELNNVPGGAPIKGTLTVDNELLSPGQPRDWFFEHFQNGSNSSADIQLIIFEDSLTFSRDIDKFGRQTGSSQAELGISISTEDTSVNYYAYRQLSKNYQYNSENEYPIEIQIQGTENEEGVRSDLGKDTLLIVKDRVLFRVVDSYTPEKFQQENEYDLATQGSSIPFGWGKDPSNIVFETHLNGVNTFSSFTSWYVSPSLAIKNAGTIQPPAVLLKKRIPQNQTMSDFSADSPAWLIIGPVSECDVKLLD